MLKTIKAIGDWVMRRGAASYRGPLSDFWYRPVASESQSGVSISDEVALRVTAFYACVKLLAEAVGSLPLFLLEVEDDTRRKAREHWLYRVLHDKPNAWQTSQEWRELGMNHLCVRGNFINRKVFTGGGKMELWPLSPDRVTIEQLPDGGLRYKHRDAKTNLETTYLQEDILHIRLMSLDGIWGMSPLSAAREALGLSVTAEGHGANFFKHRAVPGLVLRYPAGLSPEAQRKARDTIGEIHAGFGNQHRTMILPSGVEITPLPISNEDAQFLETRKFQVSEIARVFLVPPHMIGDVEKSTSWGTGIEQQAIGFVTYTLRPYLIRFEQAVGRDILEPLDMAETHKVEFALEGLLRGDSAARGAFYAQLFAVGALSPNMILRLENMDPIGPVGDQHYVPANMVRLDAPNTAETTQTTETVDAGAVKDQASPEETVTLPDETTETVVIQPDPPPPTVTTNPDDKRKELAVAAAHFKEMAEAKARHALVVDAANRIAHANIAALKRRAHVAGADRPRFEAWVDKHSATQRAYVRKVLAPLAAAGGSDAADEADRIVNRRRAELLSGDPAAVFAAWSDGLAGILAGELNHESTLAY